MLCGQPVPGSIAVLRRERSSRATPNPEQAHVRSKNLARSVRGGCCSPRDTHASVNRLPQHGRRWILRCDERRALRELAEDRQQLSDVGLTREQVLREAAKPFWRR